MALAGQGTALLRFVPGISTLLMWRISAAFGRIVQRCACAIPDLSTLVVKRVGVVHNMITCAYVYNHCFALLSPGPGYCIGNMHI